MKILITGVTGYIAQRLIPELLLAGHELVCCARDTGRFNLSKFGTTKISSIQVDFLDESTLSLIPRDLHAAYYLIHSMSTNSGDFEDMESLCARNFVNAMNKTRVNQVIYLSGINNTSQTSKHLNSRSQVGIILSSGNYHLTTLSAGIIVGSGSASFEIIRDLVEKLPVMITPKWLNTKCQPIAIRNVIEYLSRSLGNEFTFNQQFDIAGPDILSYKEMLLQFAEIRGLKRWIYTLPIMTPKLSSYWLYFVTSTSYALAKNLVNSMKVEVIGRPNQLAQVLDIQLIGYQEALRLAFGKIEQNQVLSSWKDAHNSTLLHKGLSKYIEVPKNGCYVDARQMKVDNVENSLDKIWRIGGRNGWYVGNWLWGIRGVLDQIFGGVGMRRGRKSESHIEAGDALDFWRVLLADRQNKRLLLYAEMKLPGEAWLEFNIDEHGILSQVATFRPLGILGRLYWYGVWPFHGYIFSGMLRRIAKS